MAVEAGSARPIEGAFVSLVDEGGEQLVSALTGSDGTFVLQRFTAGRYRLRVERIGYETWTSEPFLAGPGRTVTRRLEVPVQPVSLAGLEVEAASRCGSRSQGGPELARVWEEARKALEVARWTQGQRLIQYDIRTWERQLDYTNIRVLRERGRRTKRAGRAAFVSRPGEELIVKGYVRPGAGKEYVYYAPDAEVLLSDLFQNAHCFSLARGKGERDGEIGLRFQP
ncbi:MAG: carboxypeptidase-like regulatory domain-containing protein, partial [Gemmatimonadota bacterium]